MAKIKGKKSKYLKSLGVENEQWQEVRRLIRLRDNWTCQIPGCGCKSNLETHHITYFVNFKSIVGKEKEHLEWLILLCDKHHRAVHADFQHPLNPKNRNKLNAENFKKWTKL